MKTLALLPLLLSGGWLTGHAQSANAVRDTVHIHVDNEKIRAVEYVSTAGNGMCGDGMHSHAEHLTVLLTDAKVTLTTADGTSNTFQLPAGTTLWSEAETHAAIHQGSEPARVLLVYLK